MVRASTSVALVVLMLACSSASTSTPPLTSSPPPENQPTREEAAAGAAIDAITQSLRDSAAACFYLRKTLDTGVFVPDSAFLRWRAPGRRFLPHQECPLTYSNMTGLPRDAQGRPMARPPGHIDPHFFRIHRPRFDGPDRGVVRVKRGQGTWTHYYECEVRSAGAKFWRWIATCRIVDSAIS